MYEKRHGFCALLFLLLFLTPTFSSYAQDIDNIAVLNTTVPDKKVKKLVDSSDLDYISNVIRDIGSETCEGKFRIMDANNIESILKKYNKTLECVDDTQCAVDIGQTLESIYVVVSYVRKFGNQIKLTVRIYDTINMTLIKPIVVGTELKENWQNALEKEMRKNIPDMFDKVMKKEAPAISAPVPPPEKKKEVVTKKEKNTSKHTAEFVNIQKQKNKWRELQLLIESKDITKQKKLSLLDDFIKTKNLQNGLKEEAVEKKRYLTLGENKVSTTWFFLAFTGHIAGETVEIGRLRWETFQLSIFRQSFVWYPTELGDLKESGLSWFVAVAGVGAKYHPDDKGLHEIGFLSYPASGGFWMNEIPEAFEGGDIGGSDSYGYHFLITNAYYRVNLSGWALETGFQMPLFWFGGDSGAYGGRPFINYYIGFGY